MRTGTIVRTLAAVAVGAGVLLGPATAAQAVPSHCTAKLWYGAGDTQGWQGNCSSLTSPPDDEWRVVGTCVRENNSSIKVTVYGRWVGGIGVWSVAPCAANYYAGTGHVQTRDV